MLTTVIRTRLFIALVISGLLLFTGAAYSEADRADIERLLFRIQQGIQKQSSDIVLKHFRNDSTRQQSDILADKQAARQSVDALLSNFSNRSLPGMQESLSTTADFKLRVKGIRFSDEGSRAVVELLAGFAALPPDSSLLLVKSPAEMEAMSDRERVSAMQYRPLTISLMKVDGSWYVTSFRGFSEALASINQAYPNGMLPVKSGKSKD